jgi:mRNA-degrading endonuclease RelE of RelBE toxin-antitoxin system
MTDWEWIFVKPKDFREQVLRLPPPVRRNLTSTMTLLSESPNPLVYGRKKTTKYGEFYALKLDNTYRLSYTVQSFKEKKIVIYRVGDHNFVY